jgi:DNA polymerase-3 subunit epsilon
MTAKWWTGSAVGLDFESDDKDPENARIISANVTTIRGKECAPVDVMLQPERDIPEEAAAIHGISTERARAEGISRETGVKLIVSLLTGASIDAPVIGHNVGNYDLTVLDREMRRLGIGSLGLEQSEFSLIGLVNLREDGRTVATFPVIDTLVLDKMVDRFRPGKRKLEVTAAHYGVKLGDAGAHDAGADVLAALRIAWRIAQRCDEPSATLFERYRKRHKPEEVVRAFYALRELDAHNLHLRLTKVAAEQAESLREHFTRNPDKGDPATVSGAYPFRPFI